MGFNQKVFIDLCNCSFHQYSIWILCDERMAERLRLQNRYANLALRFEPVFIIDFNILSREFQSLPSNQNQPC